MPDAIPWRRTYSRLEAIVMETAAVLFSRDFSRWAIQLPPQDVAQRHRGRINQEGWAIWYLFGGDDRGGRFMAFDVPLQDVVEDVVGRQRVLIDLIRP